MGVTRQKAPRCTDGLSVAATVAAVALADHLVDLPDGLGVIEVQGDEGASVLRLRDTPVLLEGWDGGDTIVWLAGRAGRQAPRPAQLQAVRDWLAEPGLDPQSGSALDPTPLRPFLRLLAPGRYAIYAEVSAVQLIDVQVGDAPFDGYASPRLLLTTDSWPPVDQHTVSRYRQRIAAGARPAAIVLSAHADSHAMYLLDGHHKLAAYVAEA
jgi:hypothetical protein